MSGPGPQHGYRALATAVLLLALNDLKQPNRRIQDSATTFLTRPSSHLDLWTGWLGIDQHVVVDKMRRLHISEAA